MKVVILAGGLGTRLSEETSSRPKPMVEIGGRPMLWHIMSVYGVHGFKEFVLALGYKAEVIRSYFLNFRETSHDSTINLADGRVTVHETSAGEDWTVHLIDTGQETQTGGRLRRLREWIGNETFCMTYGDGVGDIDIAELVAFHRKHGKLATVTAVRPAARFGGIDLDGERVTAFAEKNYLSEGWINGGFFVLEPAVLDYIDDDATMWERAPMERLAAEGQLFAFKHDRFWWPMDTLRDVKLLEAQWASGHPPWKTWK